MSLTRASRYPMHSSLVSIRGDHPDQQHQLVHDVVTINRLYNMRFGACVDFHSFPLSHTPSMHRLNTRLTIVGNIGFHARTALTTGFGAETAPDIIKSKPKNINDTVKPV